MKTDVNGCSTCEKGQESYENFKMKLGRKEFDMIQYDYRDVNGALFTCTARNIEHARQKRDEWFGRFFMKK